MNCTIDETPILDAVEMDGARLGHSPSNNTISVCLAMTLEGVGGGTTAFLDELAMPCIEGFDRSTHIFSIKNTDSN